MSRDHSIREDRLGESCAPILSLIGGKWTTFRGFAEEAADRVLAALGRPRLRSTVDEAIGGGRDYPHDARARGRLRAEFGIDETRGEILIDRYGAGAREVARAMTARADAPLRSAPDYSNNEIAFLFEREIVGRLSDVLFRRTEIALGGRLTPELAREVAEIGAATLRWSSRRTEQELLNVAEIAWRKNRIADFDPSGQAWAKAKIREEQL